MRDLPYVVATGTHGATTVASTMRIAGLAGIRVFVTGGLGGVHQGAEKLDGRVGRPHRAVTHRRWPSSPRG